MFCIVTALKEELQPFIKRLQISAPPETPAGGALYKTDRVHLLQAGLGPKLSAETLDLYLKKYTPEFLLNAGLAGALTAGTEIERIYRISEVISGWNGNSLSLYQLQVLGKDEMPGTGDGQKLRHSLKDTEDEGF